MSTLTNVTIGLRSVDLDSAPERALWALDRDALQDRSQPPLASPRRLTTLQKAAVEHHECGHAFAAFKFGASSISVKSRDDGTGICTCDKIEDLQHAIVYHLSGPVSESLYNPAASRRFVDGKSYDFMAARIAIEAFNKQQMWPVITCQRAAETAVEFVKKHWERIGDLALALSSAGELDDHSVRILASCGT